MKRVMTLFAASFLLLSTQSLAIAFPFIESAEKQKRPNIVLMMCDDLGYGDTGFNGNSTIQTPSHNALAKRGVIMTLFYAGNSVCSPTRGTCLTGRHHDRYGIYHANQGHLPAEEITLAKMLKKHGYTTGHFNDGKLDGGFFRSPLISTTASGSALVILYAIDLEATRDKVVDCGGKIASEIFSFPGGRRFQFLDPSGNELGVWSDK